MTEPVVNHPPTSTPDATTRITVHVPAYTGTRADLADQLLEPRPGDQRRATRPRTTRRRPTWIGQTAIALGAFLAGLVTSSLWWLR